MADWTDIQSDTIEPDSPLLSATMFALRDNPKAIAEGASGAPRIVNNAMGPESIDLNKLLPVSIGTTTRFLDSSTYNAQDDDWNTWVDERLLTPGTMRVTFEHAASGGFSSEVRVLVNGSVIETVTRSGGFAEDSIDVTFSRGDRIRLQHRMSGNSSSELAQVRNIRFRTSGGTLLPMPAGYV